jgi:hypothetical protein
VARRKVASIATAPAAMGRLGGASNSPAKVAAARANGAKGGRPRVAHPVRPYRGSKP